MATGDKVVTLDGLKAVYDSQDTNGIKQDISDLKSSIGASPEDYGAKGDGVTDDTAAFNAAFDANDFVFIGGGNYYINGTVTMSANKKLIGNAENQYISKSRITLGSTGYIHVVGAACIIRNIHFRGADATSNPTTFQPSAVVADRVSPRYDIDLTIEDCIFVGFNTAVTVNGRGIYLRKTLFTYYSVALKLNFISSETGSLEVDSRFGGRAFVIEDNRFHTASGNSSVDADSICVAQNSTAYGMIVNRNLFDGSYGKINLIGDVRDSLINDNVFIFPLGGTDRYSIYQPSSGRILNLNINANVFDAESSYKYNGALPDNYISLNGQMSGLVLNANQFSYSNEEAIELNGVCSDSIISNNHFNDACFSDTATGKAVSFNGTANNISVSGNVYNDNQYIGKTNERMFAEFVNDPTNVVFSNNVAVKGTTVDISAPTYQSANGSVEGGNIRITQTSNYGGAYIKISGLDASTVYTVSASILENKNASKTAMLALSQTNTISSARVIEKLNVGTYYVDQTSSANGELYVFLRPTAASGVTGEALFGNIRIKKGFMPDTGEIDLVSENVMLTNSNSIDKEKYAELNAVKSMTVGAELFNAKVATTGKGQNQSGMAVALAASLISDFIEVTPGFTYSINQSLNSSSNYNCFYDEDGLLVEAVLSIGTAPLSVTAPAKAKYLRALGLAAQIDNFSVKVAGSPS